MSKKNIEMMKKLIEEKKTKQNDKQKLKPDKKIGVGKSAMGNMKTGGSNNKV